MSKSTINTQEMLEENIPASVVSKREAFRGGPKLSYLESWYVIDRLNQVFGNGNWNYGITELTQVSEDEHNGKYRVFYRSRVQLQVPALGTLIEDVGFGNGADKTGFGPAHELACKEAVSDALKRCAKSLGKSMGLALYDKSQTHVEGEAEAAPRSKRAAPARKTNSTGRSVYDNIATAATLLIKKRTKTAEELQQMVREKYGVDRAKNLNETQAKEFYGELRSLMDQ